MQPNTTIFRQSPFIFILRIAATEFLTTLALLLLLFAPVLRESYEATNFDEALSFPILITLLITVLQVLLIGWVFLTWYFPTYFLDERKLMYKRSFYHAEDLLTERAAITGVEVRQSSLARRLDYGTLILQLRDTGAGVALKNLSHPAQMADLFRNAIDVRMEAPLALLDRPIDAIIADGENQFAEFKASLMWDYRRQSVNKDLYEPVMKNLVAFMNTQGGVLLIGVGDDGAILGIEQDLSTMKKPNTDGFENIFNMAFSSMVGVENRQFVTLSFPLHEEKTLCKVAVQPASRPVYLRFQGKEEFYIRAGNSSQALPVSKATEFIQGRFGR